jgi:competence protein ComEA
MAKRNILIITALLTIVLIGTFLASCGSSGSTGSTGSGNTGGTDGAALMQTRCSVCHSTDRITSAHKTADEWKTTVTRMISHGAKLNATEEQTLVDYLAATYK